MQLLVLAQRLAQLQAFIPLPVTVDLDDLHLSRNSRPPIAALCGLASSQSFIINAKRYAVRSWRTFVTWVDPWKKRLAPASAIKMFAQYCWGSNLSRARSVQHGCTTHKSFDMSPKYMFLAAFLWALLIWLDQTHAHPELLAFHLSTAKRLLPRRFQPACSLPHFVRPAERPLRDEPSAARLALFAENRHHSILGSCATYRAREHCKS